MKQKGEAGGVGYFLSQKHWRAEQAGWPKFSAPAWREDYFGA
jgi:hypothetical protein